MFTTSFEKETCYSSVGPDEKLMITEDFAHNLWKKVDKDRLFYPFFECEILC